jgi:uncharacterized protein DUF4062
MTTGARTTRTVMVSSTAVDLPDHREQVVDACLQQEMLPKAMEHLPARGADAIRISREMVDEADIYVGVIGFRYGTVPAGHAISITEMEYNRALRRGIPCLIFLMHESHPLKAADVEKGKGAVKLDAFKDRLRRKHTVKYFKSPDDLRAHVINSLSQYRRTPLQADLLKSQIGSLLYRVAVVNESTTVSDQEAETVASALQIQVHRDFAPAWGIDAQIVFVPKGSKAPTDSWSLVVLDDSDSPQTLGYRDLGPDGLLRGKVFVRTSQEYKCPWSVTASDILLDMLLDPRGNRVALRQRGKDVRLYGYSACSPCQDAKFAYKIDTVSVSDFVFPAWFEGPGKTNTAKFDFANHISRPYQVLDGGFASVIDAHSDRGWSLAFSYDRDRWSSQKGKRKKKK